MAEVNENRDENSGQRDANIDGNRQDTGGETSAHSESSGWVSDARGLFGYSRLHTAASNGQATLLNSFLVKDIKNVNSKTVDGGYTPLHLAALAGHTDCVKELLEYDETDINVVDAFNRTPLEAAGQNFKTDVAKLLRSYGIIRAAKEEKGNKLEILLNKIEKEKLIDNCYDLALEAAVENDMCANAETLIMMGATNIDKAIKKAKRADIKLMLFMVRAVLNNNNQQIKAIKQIFEGYFKDCKSPSKQSNETLSQSEDADLARSSDYQILYSDEIKEHIAGGKLRTRAPIKLAIKLSKSSEILDELMSITNIDFDAGSIGWSNLHLTKFYVKWIRNISKQMVIKQLNLSQNCLSVLHMNLASHLKKCTKLNLYYNNLIRIPASILELPLIEELNLSHNKISELPSVLWSASLIYLNLSYNALKTLPDGVTERASSLKLLRLEHNELREVPKCICFLYNLNKLDISYNSKITKLPVGLGRLKNLKQLILDGLHNLEDPPPSICENSETCISYLTSRFIKTSKYYRMKLMLVGKKTVGKTTMVGRLQGKKYPKESTIGVDISEWSYRPSWSWSWWLKPYFNFSVWDFAGQEEYYATHQVFLSKRSLYLAVWNMLDEKKGMDELRPWLNNIISRAPKSRIIIVGTHLDKVIADSSKHQADTKCAEYEQYLNQIIECNYVRRNVVNILFVGLEEKLKNVTLLKNEIYKAAEECTDDNGDDRRDNRNDGKGNPIMGSEIPASYYKVDEMFKSPKLHEPILHATQFKSMIRSLNQPDLQSEAEIRAVTLFLHDNGSLLHFDDHRHNLDDLYFIKPQWLCKLMSTVITVEERNKYIKEGRISKQDLEKLFQCADHNAYPEQYLEQYLVLFNRFEVALPLDRKGSLFLIPSFLPSTKPESVDVLCSKGEYYQRKFGFQNGTVPPGLWSRLLSRLMSSVSAVKSLLDQGNERDRGLMYWRKGLCCYSSNELFVIESCRLQGEDDGISITYSSSVALGGILGQLVNLVQQIVREWFPGHVEQLEQIFICHECAKNSRQTIFNLTQLLKCVEDSKSVINCDVCGKDIALKTLAPDILLHDMDHVLKFETIQIKSDEALIWEGKFGKVYRATLDPNTPAIVKRYNINKEGFALIIQIFRAEVAYLQRMQHPCLVGMIGVCKYPNMGLVMEDSRLGSLESCLLKDLMKVSKVVVYRIAAQIASALHFLHTIPVIYRNLTISRVLIWSLSLDDMVNCKLMGLEVATYGDSRRLESFSGDKLIAPEVISQSIPVYDKRVDIYSLGIVLLQMMQRNYPSEYRDTIPEMEIPLISKSDSVSDSFIENLAKRCCSLDPADRPDLEEVVKQLCNPVFQLLMDIPTISLDGRIYCACSVESSNYSTEVWVGYKYGDKSVIIVFSLNDAMVESEKRYSIKGQDINCMISHNSFVWAVSMQADRKGSLIKFYINKKDEYIMIPIKNDGNGGRLPVGDYPICLACSDDHVYVGTALGWCLMFPADIDSNTVPIREVNLSRNFIRSMVVVKKTSLLWASTKLSTYQLLFVNLKDLEFDKDRKEVSINDYQIGKLFLSPNEEIVWTVHDIAISAWNAHNRKLISLFDLQKLLGEEVDQHKIRITAASVVLDTLWVGLKSGHILVFCAALPQRALLTVKPFEREVEVLTPIRGKDNNIAMMSIGKNFLLEEQSRVKKQNSLDVLLWEVVNTKHMLHMNCLSTGKAWLDHASPKEIKDSISIAQKQLQFDHSAPTNVKAAVIAPNSVQVTWDRSSSDVTGHFISYYSAALDVTGGSVLVDGNATCYILTNLELNTQYTITVQTVTSDNTMSVKSDEVSVTTYTDATGLSPRNVMATSNDQASWQMEWELPQKAANLEVAHEIRPYSESKVLEKDVIDVQPGVISNPVPLSSQTFDHHGGKLMIEDHGITIAIPQLAVSEGDEVDVQACASLTGPYMLPDGYELVSVFVCIEADYMFNKLVRITIPHFAAIENLDQSFNVVVLTANENDFVYNEYGDLVLQMHESVYDYQYEVNDDYCDYYTNHFCSKCLARRRSLIFRLFNRLTSSAPREAAYYNRTRITVFFCVPDDYASADDLSIELCICYSLKYCLQTVHKSYKQRKMLSSKSSNVPWTIPIDDQKSLNFCLSCAGCPGWKIKPIGSEKIKVSDLDFHSHSSLEDLRAQEELCLYPPRFIISVVRLSHGKKLDAEFTITLKNDDTSVLDEIKRFPLIVAGLEKEGLSNQQYTTDVDSSLASTATNTATTTVTTTSTNNSPPVMDISPSSSYHSAAGSISSSLAVGSVSASAASTPLATDGALVITPSDLDQTTLTSHFPVSSAAAGSTIVNSLHMGLIVQGDINFYQSKESHQNIENNGGSFNSLECFSTDINESVDLGTILPNLISHGLLTPNQRDYLTHPLRTSAETKQELCGILLSLDERCVKKFLQCLSETSHYDPHKLLLNKIQTKIKEETEEVN